MPSYLRIVARSTQKLSEYLPKDTRYVDITLYMELMALMTHCLLDRACPRRIQEIRLLLRRLQSERKLPMDLEEKLEDINDCWEHFHYSL